MKRPYRIERCIERRNGTRWVSCSSSADIERAKKIMVRAAGEWQTRTRIVDRRVPGGPVLYLCVRKDDTEDGREWEII